MSRSDDTKHDPRRPVATHEELERLLLAGLASGEPSPMSEADWERLRQRALGTVHAQKLG